MSLTVSIKTVFGSEDVNANICMFLNSAERQRYRLVDHSCHEGTQLAEKTEKEMRRVQAYQSVFANRNLRGQVLSCLTIRELDLCKRVKPSYNRNITAFQDARVRRLFPAELRDVVARATFQNVVFGSGIPNQNQLSATIVVGYNRGKPYLACKANVINGRFSQQTTLVVKDKVYGNGDWYLDGFASGLLEYSFSKFAEFVKVGKMAPEWARQERDGCCTRIYYVFRRMCCVVVRPTIVWPELRLPDEKSASDKQENKKA